MPRKENGINKSNRYFVKNIIQDVSFDYCTKARTYIYAHDDCAFFVKLQ
ncbi:MAG: hypothetical protein PUG66_06460 [Clostridiales bacterium]|nr:hypothetical protein [Clostridiales bacterium]